MLRSPLVPLTLALASFTLTAGAAAADSKAPAKASAKANTKPTLPEPRTPEPRTPEPNDADAGADPASLERAKALFERGASAYGQGHYYEAIEIFTETSRVYPNPQLAFNIAKAYDNLGSRPGALRYYRDYLRRSPNAPDHEAVTTRVRELEQALAERGVQQLTVLSDPADATVLLDGQPVGLTPWTGETWPGRHRLVITHPGYALRELVAELEPLHALDVTTTLEPLPAAPPVKSPPSPSADAHRGRNTSALTWATLGVGTASLGTAIVIEASVDANGRKLSPASAFFAGLGAAATAVGCVMLYLDLEDHEGPKDEEPKPERRAAIGFDGRTLGARYQQSF